MRSLFGATLLFFFTSPVFAAKTMNPCLSAAQRTAWDGEFEKLPLEHRVFRSDDARVEAEAAIEKVLPIFKGSEFSRYDLIQIYSGYNPKPPQAPGSRIPTTSTVKPVDQRPNVILSAAVKEHRGKTMAEFIQIMTPKLEAAIGKDIETYWTRSAKKAGDTPEVSLEETKKRIYEALIHNSMRTLDAVHFYPMIDEPAAVPGSAPPQRTTGGINESNG